MTDTNLNVVQQLDQRWAVTHGDLALAAWPERKIAEEGKTRLDYIFRVRGANSLSIAAWLSSMHDYATVFRKRT